MAGRRNSAISSMRPPPPRRWGQVHRATTLDGRKLACKLQYPDMASAVEADLGQLRLILGIFERYDRAVSTKKIHEEISERLREELDYESARDRTCPSMPIS